MADRRTRQNDSPRRRKRESTKAIVDQDEFRRTRGPYQPEEIASSYSSSSSYIDISRPFPSNRIRGLGAIRAFFVTPSEHRRRPRRRGSRPYLRGDTSSSSSINTDLAYGTGYIRRRKGDKRRRNGRERETSGRRDPRADKDPDAAILEVGAGLAAIARAQNKLYLTEARKQGIQHPRRSDSSILKQPESNRGLGSSKLSHDADEEGWESATDADSEASSVDPRLAYGHENNAGWGFFRSGPKRKESVVNPSLFGPANSLHGVVNEPVGFGDVDYENLSDYPPPTVATLQREQSHPLPTTITALQRDQKYPSTSVASPMVQGTVSDTASATGPMRYVYPVPTSDPTKFDAERGSVVSAQEQYGSRPAPVPFQQAPIPIAQPQPKPIVAQSVFEQPYSNRSEPKISSTSARSKSSVAGAALAGVAGGIIASSMISDRKDERGDKKMRGDARDAYEGEPRADPRKDESREQRDGKDADYARRERRRERDREGTEETREERRERRRREKRDDPDYERREKRSERRREDPVPDDGLDRRRGDKYAERTDNREGSRQTRKDAPVVPPVDPFQYQVADDAFKTPDGTRNSEPFSSIQRARSPAVVTVERVPHWHRDASSKEENDEPVRDVGDEKDLEARENRETEREAVSLYKEIEQSTIPVDAAAVSVAVITEENRRARDKVRKRRYDRSSDTSPNGERDPIQEEADRIYREAILARKLAESDNDDPVARIVTPPEMVHKKDKEILYPVPNADFQLDHVMDPVEFMASPIKGQGEDFDRIKSLSGVGMQDLNRPLLTLVRPTPTPSPAPEEQISRSKSKKSSREIKSSESKTSESDRERSSREEDQPEQIYRKSERKEYSRDREPSEAQKIPDADTVVTGSRGEATQTPTSANGTKSVTWGENDTREIIAESPYEVKDDPISNMGTASEGKDKPKMSKERKASAWGALRGAFISGAAAEIVAKTTETPKDVEPKPDRSNSEAKPEGLNKDKKPEGKENPRSEPFEYRGVLVEPEHSDNETRERGPPAVGPKPAKMPRSNMPGAFDEDLDFTATVAAGLEDSGFDPDIVIKDPKYRRRSSPPGSEDPPLAGYKQAYAETVSDISQYGIPAKETSRGIRVRENDSHMNNATENVQRLAEKPPGGQVSETRDLDYSESTGQLVEEPESLLESSRSKKSDKKREKSRKSKDSYDEVDDRSSKKVSVPVDYFDDIRAEADQVGATEDWNSDKKSKRKSKRDSGQFESPSRSMSVSDRTSSVDQSKKKSKDRSSKRSSQYDSEPNPEDVPLPSASEISRDDDYDSRKSKKSSKKGSSASDVADRDTRSVKSDSSRYADEDDSRSSKKEKRSSGFFSGIFGSSTSKSDPEPERAREVDESELKRKKKPKRDSNGDSSALYGADTKTDTKPSSNGNGYNNYDVDDRDTKRTMNGDNKRGKSDEGQESFLDKAGPLGAGAGLAAAIALAAQHQHAKAAKSEPEERVPQEPTPEDTSLTMTPAIESRDIFEENIVDPDIVQRKPRPSVDPQYGDLLPLPPSNPGSPNVEPEDTLPTLPETPPGTPPKIENVPARDRSVGSSRRNDLPTLAKTPSQSAIPIKYIMGNRSTPSSPGMVRAPVMASPSAMSPDALNLHRIRPRPTSWDSTREIQPLYLLDPNRRAPASQSTDSELQSPVVDDTAKQSNIPNVVHAAEVSEDVPSSDVCDIPEVLQVNSSTKDSKSDTAPGNADPIEFPDFTTLPPLPVSRAPTPIEKGVEEQDLSSLPPLPKSGVSTPVDISEISRSSQLPETTSPASVEDRPRDSDRNTATVLAGAVIALSAGAIAIASNRENSLEDEEPHSEASLTKDLPAEFQVEPITKDRSSYLFQPTPPAKRTNDSDARPAFERQSHGVDVLPQSMEEISPVDDVVGDNQDSPTRARSTERATALQALTRSVPKDEESLMTAVSDRAIPTDDVEPDDANEFSFTKQKKNKRKDKRRQANQIGVEDNFSSGTATSASTIDASRDTGGTSEFSIKKPKKEKKKDKKRGSTQMEAEDVFSEKTEAAPIELAPVVDDGNDAPSEPVLNATPLLVAERSLEDPGIATDNSAKEPREEDDSQMKPTGASERESGISPTTVHLSSVTSTAREVNTTDEPSQPRLPDVLSAPSEPTVDSEAGEDFSTRKDKTKALDLVDSKDDAPSSTSYSLPVVLGAEEAETIDKPSEMLPESVRPSYVMTADDNETFEDWSPQKTKKGRKKDKKKAFEDKTEASPISVQLSSVASAPQDPDPLDDNSSKTSKKGKKKDKMNRKSLSRSATFEEPAVAEPIEKVVPPIQNLDDPTQSVEGHTQGTDEPLDAAKEATQIVNDSSEDIINTKALEEHTPIVENIESDFSKAQQMPLPISKAPSEAENETELGDIDANTQSTISSQEERLQPAETVEGTTFTKESKKSNEDVDKSLAPSGLDKPLPIETVENKTIPTPVDRDTGVVESESRNINNVHIEPQSEPRAEANLVKGPETEGSDGESMHIADSKEPLMQAGQELAQVPQVKDELPKNVLPMDELEKSDKVREEIFESVPELSILAKPVQKEIDHESSAGDPSIKGEPTNGDGDLGIVDLEAAPSTEDGIRGVATEVVSGSSNAKDLKKSKKKKGKSTQARQDDESLEFQSPIEPFSEPTTAAASEREDLSGFSTPTSKGKGRKKQKRKSIAWDLPETEAESQPGTVTSNLTTSDTPEETPSREVSALPQLDTIESISKDNRMNEPDHVQASMAHEEVFRNEPEVETMEIGKSLSHKNPTTFPTNPIQSEISSTTQVESSARESLPLVTALHKPQVSKEVETPVDTSYLPSAADLLPTAAALVEMAAASKALGRDPVEHVHAEDASLSPETPHERVGTPSSDPHREKSPADEPVSHPREVLGTDAELSSPVMTHALAEHVISSDNSVGDTPKQLNTNYFPSATILHSPSSTGPAGSGEDIGAKGYFPSATALLPFQKSVASSTPEPQPLQSVSAEEGENFKEPPIPDNFELDKQSLPAEDHKPTDTSFTVPEKDVFDLTSEGKDAQSNDGKSPTQYNGEILEAGPEDFGSGRKKSKKGSGNRASLSRSPTQTDEVLTEGTDEREQAPEEIEPVRDILAIKKDQHANGLDAGYKEEQVLLAKQLQSEFDSTTKKSKGKKSRSTSRTPRDYESGSPLPEESQMINEPSETDTQLAAEVGRDIIPEEEGAPKQQGPDGLTAGFTLEQLEAARQMNKEFASGSSKSKKDRKLKGLIRSATDENVPGIAGDDGSEETSLATTEVDSATDSPNLLSTVASQDTPGYSFTKKVGKKGRKRQSLLRSLTHDSEDSAGPGREITAEPGPIELDPSVKETSETPQSLASVPNFGDIPTPAVIEEPEPSSISTKKDKKGSKKRQSIIRSAAQEDEPSSDPTSGTAEQELTQRNVTEPKSTQSPGIIADDIAILGEELNYNLKKAKSKKSKKGKNFSEKAAETEDISQTSGQASSLEKDIKSGTDPDQGSLADRIWAGVVQSESSQPENKNSSAESEDPLGLYTTKKVKKSRKKGQMSYTPISEPETVPTDRNARDPDCPVKGQSSDKPLSLADEAEAEAEQKQPRLFDAWSFGNIPADTTAQETSPHESEAAAKDIEVTDDNAQEERMSLSSAASPKADSLVEAPAIEQHGHGADIGPIDDLETPPPVMPKVLAWEDELQPQQTNFETAKEVQSSAPDTKDPDQSDSTATVKHGVSKTVSVGILAAGAALLAGASVKHGNEPAEEDLASTEASKSIAENKDADAPRLLESKRKREKRPAKLSDRRSILEDDLFDDPILWDGAETQKYGDHTTENDSGDDLGFWSGTVEDVNTKDDFAIDDKEDGPSSMPHKRERSESLMDVWEPSTVLDHIKTPRKHRSEDIPAAIARDAIIDQEMSGEQAVHASDHNRDILGERNQHIDDLEPISQSNDIPEDTLTHSSSQGNKRKKKSKQIEAWDPVRKDAGSSAGPTQTMSIDPASSQDTDTPVIEIPHTSIKRDSTRDLDNDMDGEESRSASSPTLPLDSELERPLQRNLDEESVKHKHRRQEVYLPLSSTEPKAIDNKHVLQRELDFTPPERSSQAQSESRTKDKHRRQESYFPPPSTLPIVIEEDDRKPELEHTTGERSIIDNNRDSAFVADSPVPIQRRFADDFEYKHDSGVHLREWGDTPMSKEKSHVASADAALARLSWPPVDEKMETVDLKGSQRPKEERSPKAHGSNPVVAATGAVAVAELAHLATHNTPLKKDEYRENARFDRSITPNMGRLQTPDHARHRPGSVDSTRSSGTPPLRRRDRKLSGDLRSLSQRSQANLAKEAKDMKDAKEAERSPATSIVNINPIANEGRPRVKDMADVYDGYGEGRIGSPMSPTRPHSMRRRQSMQVLDLEARLEQLAAENRALAEAKELAEHSLQSSQKATLTLADRDAEVDSLKQTLDWLHREVERLKEVNDGLTSANVTLGRQHNERYSALESQHINATRELDDLRQTPRGLSGGSDEAVLESVAAATEEKDREILQLRQDLEAAHERIREMQREILTAKSNDGGFLIFKDEDYFDTACQQLCQHVQQWVLRFSKFSDMRACRRTTEINNDKIIDRLDNAVLDGSDVDEYLSDRVKRRDIFMSMTMTMIWEFVFTRYLFGMDREQRQKLKSLEKTLLEVGPPAAVHQWRATTLTLLSKRDAFQQQRQQDTVAVVQMIFQTLSEILPPPSHLEDQIQEQLMRVMKSAVDLSIEMRTQRAEYMMLPPLQPEYDANGDLARQVQFNAALMNERSGDTVSNEDLEAQNAVVRIVLFPLVVKKGDDTGGGDDEIVVCPAQVLVAKPKRHARGLTPEGLGQNSNHSRVSMQSGMPVEQLPIPDI